MSREASLTSLSVQSSRSWSKDSIKFYINGSGVKVLRTYTADILPFRQRLIIFNDEWDSIDELCGNIVILYFNYPGIRSRLFD